VNDPKNDAPGNERLLELYERLRVERRAANGARVKRIGCVG